VRNAEEPRVERGRRARSGRDRNGEPKTETAAPEDHRRGPEAIRRAFGTRRGGPSPFQGGVPTAAGGVRLVVLPAESAEPEKHLDRASAEAPVRREHRDDEGGAGRGRGRNVAASGSRGRGGSRAFKRCSRGSSQATATRPRTQWRRCLLGCRENPGASRVIASRRRLPGMSKGHAVPAASPRHVDPHRGPSPRAGQGLRTSKAALQPLWKSVHRSGSAGRGRRQIRYHRGQHDWPVEVRNRDAVQPPRRPAGEPRNSPAGLDPVEACGRRRTRPPRGP